MSDIRIDGSSQAYFKLKRYDEPAITEAPSRPQPEQYVQKPSLANPEPISASADSQGDNTDFMLFNERQRRKRLRRIRPNSHHRSQSECVLCFECGMVYIEGKWKKMGNLKLRFLKK